MSIFFCTHSVIPVYNLHAEAHAPGSSANHCTKFPSGDFLLTWRSPRVSSQFLTPSIPRTPINSISFNTLGLLSSTTRRTAASVMPPVAPKIMPTPEIDGKRHIVSFRLQTVKADSNFLQHSDHFLGSQHIIHIWNSLSLKFLSGCLKFLGSTWHDRH